ncbi:hypothetical protein ACVWYN_003329 [Pedobacter sp. UYP24]
MAFSEDGLFGKTNGKIGNLVYYQRMGKNVVRRVGKTLKPATEAQLRCRMEMGVTSAFLKPLKGFVYVGFALEAAKLNQMVNNTANSNIKLNALKGTYPDITIDFPKVLVSKGDLKPAENPKVEKVAEGLKFTWDTTPDMAWPELTDQAMLLVYFPADRKALYNMFGPNRIGGTALLEMATPMLEKPMEVYISFITADRKQIANSLYVGNVNV